jgi:hypothetical protein
MSVSNYAVNATPLLTEYNNTNQNYSPLIPADVSSINKDSYNTLVNIRGNGNYNPAPNFAQTNNYGPAYSNIKPNNKIIYGPETNSLYVNSLALDTNTVNVNPVGAVQSENSWSSNINHNLKLNNNDNDLGNSDYSFYDEYQRFALNNVRKTDPYLLPYYFSKINVKFIQNKVVKYIQDARNITINTNQDIDGLLLIMVSNYRSAWDSGGIIGQNPCATNPGEDTATYFSNILAKLNQYTIQQYVKSVLSSLDMTQYYLKDISSLPMPLSRSIATDNKGKNDLGFVGFFEDNHEFTRNINSFNMRNTLPGKIDSVNFGN